MNLAAGYFRATSRAEMGWMTKAKRVNTDILTDAA
jgi:hypothetical protein